MLSRQLKDLESLMIKVLVEKEPGLDFEMQMTLGHIAAELSFIRKGVGKLEEEKAAHGLSR
jgi:hypothetical protein